MMQIPSALLEGLKSRYAEPQRYYHCWAHIEALREHYQRWEGEFSSPVPVLWALYWHDAIYDPMAKDNEEQSAQLLELQAENYLSANELVFAAGIIRTTTKHEVPTGLSRRDEEDLSLFLDIDLSILGARPDVFDQYERDIRAEYSLIPDDAFRAGRKAILQRFVERERIYFTALAHAEWDALARDNLRRSVAALS